MTQPTTQQPSRRTSKSDNVNRARGAIDTLAVGAAKVEITPAPERLPAQCLGVHDPIYTRAIVLDNGQRRAALVTLDAGSVSTDTFNRVSRAIHTGLGISSGQPHLDRNPHPQRAAGPGRQLHPPTSSTRSAAHRTRSDRRRCRTARACATSTSTGTGTTALNHQWWEGPNYDGVSDKTVAVLSFTAEDQQPIAVLYNYGVHAVLTGQLDQISADLPGAASDYIEDSLGEGVVALWSEGTAGDQNPIYFQQTYDLRALRVAEYAARGIDISNSMPPGGEGLDRNNPQVAKLMSQQTRLMMSMGQILGEEVLQTLRATMERPQSRIEIVGGHKAIAAPDGSGPTRGAPADPAPTRAHRMCPSDSACCGSATPSSAA